MSNIDLGNLINLGDLNLGDLTPEIDPDFGLDTSATDSIDLNSISRIEAQEIIDASRRDRDEDDPYRTDIAQDNYNRWSDYLESLGVYDYYAPPWYNDFARASAEEFLNSSVQIIYQSIQDAALARLSLLQSDMLSQVQAGNDTITRPSLGSVEGGEIYQVFWEEFSGPMNAYLDNLFGDADSITREELLDNPEFVQTGIYLASSSMTNPSGEVTWSTTDQDQVDTYTNLYETRQTEIAQQEADAAAEEERQRQAAITNAGNIFSDLGYEATQEEKEQFADNPDGIADYVDPRQVTTEEARQVLNDAGIPDSVLDGEFAERWATVINGATGQGDENFQSTVDTNLGDYADKRIVTEEEAAEYFRDLGYEPSPEEIADFVGVIDDPMRIDNYDTRNNVGEYVDPRQITREELEAIAAEQGYTLDEDDYKKYVGQSDNTSEIEGRLVDAELDFDANSVTAEELASIAADEGYTLSAEEAQSLVGNRNERELQEQLDAGAVTEQELKDIAEAQNYDLGNLSEEEYATLVGNVTEADVINNIDSRAVTIEEVIEIYEDQIGETIDEEAAKQLLASAGYLIDDATGDIVPGSLNEETFKEYVGGVERSLGETLSRLGQNVLDLIFGKDPTTGGSKSIQQIIEEQLELALPPSPSDPDYMRKYVEWLKRQSGSIISINHDPTQGIFAGVRFPVPIPISGPEITIPLFDENGNYIGGNVGQIFLNEVGDIITETGERVGQLAEDGLQILNDAGEVIRSIPLVQIGTDENGNPEFGVEGWEEGDPNPFDLDQNDDGQIDDPGLPVVEEQDEDGDEDEPPDAEAIEEDAYDGMFNNDVDGDGIPNDQDEFPNDPNNGVDPDAPDEDPDGTGEVDPVDPDDTDEGTTDTSDDIPEGDRVAYLSDVEGAKEEVLAEIGNPEDGTGLWGELNALGLENDEITALLGNPSGVDEDGNPIEAQGLYALVEGAATSDELTAAITQIEGFIGQPQYAEDGTTIIGGTGLFGLYDETQDIKDVLGEPQYDEEGNLTSDSTGIFSDLYNQQQAITNLNDLSPEQVRDIVDAALEDYDFENLTQTEVEDIVADALEEYGFENLSEQDVKDIVGEPERDDEGNLTGGTGIYGDLYAQQQDITNLTTLVSNLNNLSTSDVRTVVENILTEQGLDSLNDLSEEQVEAIVDRIVGSPATDDEDASGLYALVGNLNDLSEDDVTRIVTTALGDLEDLSKEDVTGIVNDIVGTPATDDEDASGLFALLEGQQAQISEVTDLVGEPTLNEDGEIVGGTGLYGELYAAGLRDDEILNLIGTPDNPETDENEASGLYLAYQQGTDATQNYIDTNVLPEITSISDRVGTPDDPNTEENEATGLYLAVEEGDQAVIDYIGAPEIDPETGEIVGGTGLYADLYALGLDTDRIIELIGDPESETGLYGLIGSPAIPDDPNTPEDESRPGTGVYGQIDAFAGEISDQIDTSQEETNQYLDYISGVIGRPASELTQDDVDMVIDLLAEDEFISDFNNDVRLYDVNFDGQIDQTDIGLLQGFVDAGVEGIGEIPATGIYADAARRQEEITGDLRDQADETRELIGDEAAETRRIVGQQNLFNALLGSGDLMGRQVDVKTPDPVQLKYIYDFSDIFATPQQRGLFPSPYGAPQRQAAQQVAQQRGIMSGPLNLGGLQGRPGMAAGGKVDYDFTDEIMHIMSYGDS